MRKAPHHIEPAAAMQERARQVLELTYHDWRLHEQPKRRGKIRVSHEGLLVRYRREHGIAVNPSGIAQAFA